MLGHPDQRVAQAIEVLGGGRPVHPLDGANRRGTGRSNSAPTGRVAPETPHCSREQRRHLLDLADYDEPVLRRLDLLPQQSRVAGEADELPRCQEIDHARPRIGRPQQRALAGLAGAPEEERGPRAPRESELTLEHSPRIIMYPRRPQEAWRLKNELMTATGNSGVAAPLAQSSRLSP